jgi:DNA-binding response OmpR family regulator
VEPRRKRTKRIEELYVGWRDNPPLRAGGLTLDPRVFEAYIGPKPCGLTPHEFAILYYIATTTRYVTRGELARAVWAQNPPDGRAIGGFVTRIRRKLRDLDPKHEYVQGVWRQGYRFARRPAER